MVFCSKQHSVLACCILALAGCKTAFESNSAAGRIDNPGLPETERNQQSMSHDTHPMLDGLERAIEKTIRPFSRSKSHRDPTDDQISAETRDILNEYLARHHVENINIVFNEYNTSASFRRLRNNPHVSSAVRYTAGMATVVGGGIVSNRVIDRNVYNPFTNTLELNSDRPAQILGLVAVARRKQDLNHSDGYAMLSAMPVASSIIHSLGANDAAEFAKEADLWEVEQQAHRDAYKHGSRAITMGVMPVAPFYAMPLIAVGGDLTARRLAQRRITRRDQERLAGRDETEIPSVAKPRDD